MAVPGAGQEMYKMVLGYLGLKAKKLYKNTEALSKGHRSPIDGAFTGQRWDS